MYENASNKSELRDWKSDVDALNAQEWAVIGGVGLSIFNIVKASIVSHASIDSIKDAAVSAGGTAVGIGFLCSTYNKCAISYRCVFNATNNKHY